MLNRLFKINSSIVVITTEISLRICQSILFQTVIKLKHIENSILLKHIINSNNFSIKMKYITIKALVYKILS